MVLIKKSVNQTKFQTKVQCFFFFQIKFSSPDNITARNSKINITKSYILVDAVGVLALM